MLCSETILAKYAITSSPKKFLLQTKFEMFVSGKISQSDQKPAGPISFNEISRNYKV